MQFAEVKDSCIAYMCDKYYDGWVPGARACVCFEQDFLEFVDSKFEPELTRCCPKGYAVEPDLEAYDQIRCISVTNSSQEIGQRCLFGNYTEYDLRMDKYEITDDGKLILSRFGKNTTLNVNSTDYCVANRINDVDSPTEMLKRTIERCVVPCGGKTPCLLACGSKFKPNATYMESHGLGTDNIQVTKYSPCPKGYNRTLLNPKKRCMDNFTLNFTSTDVILDYWGKTYNSREFCVLDRLNQVLVEYCKKDDTSVSLT